MADRPPAFLFTGPEELLLRRAAERLLDELRAEGDLEVVDIRAADLRDGGLPDLQTGSLFGGARALLLRDAQELPADTARALLQQLERPPPEATVILLAAGTGRIVKLAKRIEELGGRVDVQPPKDWAGAEWARLVAAELRRHDRAADRSAVDALVAHAGYDIASIAEKVAQVAAAAPPGPVTAEQVEEIVVGVGSRGGFALVDAVTDRAPAQALVLLRGALEGGDDPLQVLGLLAYRLRAIVAVAGDVDPKESGVRVSAGQRRYVERARRNFGPGELTRAYRVLADADKEIKSGDTPPELVIERAVVEIATRSPA